MRVRLTIDATIEYDAEVLQTFADIRLLPSERGNYSQLALKLDVEPAAWQDDYVDIYGTRVTTVHAVDAHDLFSWHAQAEFEVDHELLAVQEGHQEAEATMVAVAKEVSWEDVELEERQDRWIDFLGPIDGVTPDAEVIAEARTQERPYDAISTLATAIAPSRRTSKPSLAKAGDLTNSLVGALRALKIPTRFVSGYIVDGDLWEADDLELRLSSWVEVWCGAWLPIDPGTGKFMPPDSMTIGYGRDRNDVQPVRALHAGPATASAKVRAMVTRIS